MVDKQNTSADTEVNESEKKEGETVSTEVEKSDNIVEQKDSEKETKEEQKEEENTEVVVEEIKKEDWKKKIKPGMTIRVHQKIRELNAKSEMKERVQVFEGIVIAHKHGQEVGATIMVRKVSNNIGVEKIFPIHSPNIVKVEMIKKAKIRRAKLFFLRFKRKKKKRLKERKIV